MCSCSSAVRPVIECFLVHSVHNFLDRNMHVMPAQRYTHVDICVVVYEERRLACRAYMDVVMKEVWPSNKMEMICV